MVPGLSGNRDPSPPCFPSVWSLSRKPDHRKNPGASGSLPGGSGKARGRRNRMVYGMEGLPLGQTPGRGTCTGAFEKPAPLYQGGKYFLCGRRHLSQYAVCTPTVPDRWELWLCSCGCRDAYPEQERAYPVTSGTSG